MRLPNPRNPAEGMAVLHAARRAGITYFDTAPYYCDDRSESIFGEALRTMPNSSLPLYTSELRPAVRKGNASFDRSAVVTDWRSLRDSGPWTLSCA